MSSWVGRARLLASAMFAIAMALEAPLAATTPTVPEIDGSTLSTGLGLLAAGVLIVRARRRAK